MNSKIGVLVFSAGEINSIELHDALANCVNIRLYGVSSVDRHGEFVFKNYISGLPMISDVNCIRELNNIIDKNGIDIIIPTHDDIVVFLSENQERINAKVLAPDLNTSLICRDKKATYELFSKYSFCPRIYDDIYDFPVFIKPRKAQGSVGARLIFEKRDVPADLEKNDYVFCEYLPGKELTVDCFTDKNGKIQAIMPRSRQRIFGGVSVRTQSEELTEEIRYIANCINDELSFLGMWYFQVKQDASNRYKLLEVSARCAGTMCLSRALGVNLPLLSIYAALGYETIVQPNSYSLILDRMLISRYKTGIQFHTVYIDLDDTLIIDGKVHLPMIRFLYQCVNEGKRIVLVTRHNEDHDDTVIEVLKKHHISKDIFDDIYELTFNESKSGVIFEHDAIFIDNSFKERNDVYLNCKIPVFDVDTIEILLDWRN